MAFGSRNSTLTVFFLSGIVFAAVLVVSAVLFIFVPGGKEHINFFESHPFWFTYDITPHGVLWSLIGLGLLVVAGFITFYLFRVFFKKIGQAEIFFFALFFFSLLPESLRMASLCIQIFDLSPFFGIILSRVVYGGRLFGLLSLFFASLYALDLQYQKFEIVVGIMLLIALLLSFSIPFDSQLLLSDGLYKLSDEQGFFIIYSSLVVCATVTYLITVARGRLFAILAGVVLLLAGRELLFYALSPLFLALGGVAFLAGFLFVYRGFESNYNWM